MKKIYLSQESVDLLADLLKEEISGLNRMYDAVHQQSLKDATEVEIGKVKTLLNYIESV
jgi:hypothetical protein